MAFVEYILCKLIVFLLKCNEIIKDNNDLSRVACLTCEIDRGVFLIQEIRIFFDIVRVG